MSDEADAAQVIETAERDSVVAAIRRAIPADDQGRSECTDCARPIPADRLQANPGATRCVRCQAALEGVHRLFSKG